MTKLAGVAENNVARLLDVFAKLQPGRGYRAGSSRKQVASSLRRPSSVPVDDAAFAGLLKIRLEDGPLQWGRITPIRRPGKRIGSAKATEPPHLGQTLLLRQE